MEQMKLVFNFTPTATMEERKVIQYWLEKIRIAEREQWRECRRKDYKAYACAAPRGYVFANKYTHPVSYEYLHGFGSPLVHMSLMPGKSHDMQQFITAGYEVTDGSSIVVCSLLGELRSVPMEQFVTEYTDNKGNAAGTGNLPIGKWMPVKRKGTTGIYEVGLRIPEYYRINVKCKDCFVINDKEVTGHEAMRGDILILPRGKDGRPEYNKGCKTVTNSEFALTYDQIIGGWGQSGKIIKAKDIEDIVTLKELQTIIKF